MSGVFQQDKRSVIKAITISKAARRLKVCEGTVRRRCDAGEIKCFRNEFGTRIILEEDLEASARKRGL
jgi:hypothetical protein